MSDLILYDRIAVDPAQLGEQLWDAIMQLYIQWNGAARLGDSAAAARAEQELRFFALHYSSLQVDGTAVTTGRKAIVLSAYAQLGGRDCAHVMAMIESVIRREDAAAGT